ncbi:hypothetical protein CJP74_00840 [Psittacicella melopsittaci]|uniref:Type I restriction modification DNA specificity domain-containing protein n=1 Tax=Psittacicella melopsittaci TaxID=2028576 RepID=A0A3A1Y9K9_9GAMM|nr:restriction endonuclease subunit S [Psittacicella melopsittaci]RIY33878.1 hypothetical protein CJP74_00840 [Psittacicella melopsittaci]
MAKKQTHIPPLRFAQFTQPWQEFTFTQILYERKTYHQKSSQYPLVSFTAEKGVTAKTQRYDREGLVVGNKAEKIYKVTHAGDIVYNPANLKFGAIALNRYGTAVFSPIYVTFALLEPEENSELFFGQYVTRPSFIQHLLQFEEGTVYERQAVKPKVFLAQKGYAPSYSEQVKIGQLFNQLDSQLDLIAEQVTYAKYLKESILTQVFTHASKPRLRFPQFSKSFTSVPLKKILRKDCPKNKNLEVTYVESISNKHGFISQVELFSDLSLASKELRNYTVITPGSFAYNPSRINVGSIAYKEPGQTPAIVSPLYVCFKVKEERVNPHYFLYWIKSPYFAAQRQKFSEGSVREILNYKRFSALEMRLPSLGEQEKVVTLLQSLDALIYHYEQMLEQAKALKQALSQRMFV